MRVAIYLKKISNMQKLKPMKWHKITIAQFK